MAQFKEEDDIRALEQAITKAHNEIDRLSNITEDLENIKSEWAEETSERIDEAEDKLDTTEDRLEDAQEKLETFLEKANIAVDFYERLQQESSPRLHGQYEKACNQADRYKQKLDSAIVRTSAALQKTNENLDKARVKIQIIQTKIKAHKDKDSENFERINFTLPKSMKNDWKNIANDLKISVSDMVRTAVESYKDGMETKKDFSGFGKAFEDFGNKMEKMGAEIERSVKENIEQKYDPQTGELLSLKIKAEKGKKHKPIKIKFSSDDSPLDFEEFEEKDKRNNEIVNDRHSMNEAEKERIKKILTGIITSRNSLPLNKLAKLLHISLDDAEDIIYEMIGEGISGKIEENTFTFKGISEDVLSHLFKIIDNM